MIFMNVKYETDRWNPLIGSRMELMMDIVEVLIEETGGDFLGF